MPLNKMRLLTGLIIGLSLLGQSCTIADKQFEEVLNSPNKFHEKEIEIIGIIHERPEDNAIYLTEDSGKENAVWVEYLQILRMINSYEGLDGSKIKLKGEFDKNEKGHLGQYSGTLRNAQIVDVAE